MRIGVVTGLKFEADILRKSAKSQDTEHFLYASVSGNQDDSYEAAKGFVKAGAKALISFGIAGGLTDDVPVGKLVLADKVFSDKGAIFHTDTTSRKRLLDALKAELDPVVAPMISLSYPLSTEEEKRGGHRETGALGVDMESFGVARAAKEMGVPFLVIRSISDGASDLLPSFVVPAMGPGGKIKLGPVMKSLITHPGEIPDVIGFGFKTKKANATLRRVCLLGLPFLGFQG